MMKESLANIELSDREICKNCENQLAQSTTYCDVCGQKVITQRMTTKGVLNEIFASITNIENGFWYSLKSLVLHPHKFLSDYLQGGTKKYTNVFRLIFLLTAVNFFINQYSGLMDAQMSVSTTPGDSEMTADVIRAIQNYMMYLFFLMIPFFALASYFLFRKHKLFYAEHLVLNSTWLSGTTLLGFLTYTLLPFVSVDNMPIYGTVAMTIFIGYFTFANKKFFDLSWPKSFLLSCLHLFLGYISFFLLFGLLSVIGGYIYAALTH